jgi:hypothetical protein
MNRSQHPFLVDVLDLVKAAQRAGFGLTPHDVRTAAQRGELVAVQRSPLLFTVAEANRWLSDWTRAATRRAEERRR